jgi:apolipoprotein N-acyltransferase
VKYKNLLLSLASGLMLWLAWPPLPLFFLLFVGLVPVMFIERNIANNRKPLGTLFGYTYLAFLVWNGATTWWIWIATPAGAVGAIGANAFLMSIPILLFHTTKKRCGEYIGYMSLPIYWIAFEYLHHQWELAWPWLTLGNGFAMYPQLVQWYEWTGALGGSLWIWVVNILIFQLVRARLLDKLNQKRLINQLVAITAALLIPATLSILRFTTYEEQGRSVEVVVVQPNIDPYHEKFYGGDRFIPYQQQIERLLTLSEKMSTPNTRFWVWPETAIPVTMDVKALERQPQVLLIRQVLDYYPEVSLVTGIDGEERQTQATKSATSRPHATIGDLWMDYFNTAILLDSTRRQQYYHKSKLVPGVERMPYPKVFRFLERFAIDLGGISGSLGMQDERTVLLTSDSSGVAPVICFESVFGEYVGEYIRNGADAIFVITNDGWWGTTAGHRQHLYFSSLRAIETRRYVARSANTGISCFVDQRGTIHQRTKYGEQASIRGNILLNDRLTFYTRHGDMLGRALTWLSAALIIYTIVLRIRKRRTSLDIEQPAA